MQDYNYLAVGTFELTLEISCCKYPYASELPEFWEYNRDALINFLFEAHIGLYVFHHLNGNARKSGLLDFPPGLTQIGLYMCRRMLGS